MTRAVAQDEGSFKENEHPRGQPGNPGQFSSGGGGSAIKREGTGGSSGIKSGSSKEGTAPDFKENMARESKGDTTQPVASLDDLYERAKTAEPGFKKTVEATAQKHGSEVSYTPEQYAEPGTILKSRSSAERKLKSELGDDPKLLRDVIRATVVSDSVESTRKAAADFIGEHGDDILRVKDRYASEAKGGYRDILINYRTPEGLVAEVQFNSKNMVKAKNEEAHSLYEKARVLVNPTAEMLAELENAMSAIYEKAYLADGDGKGWLHSFGAKDAAPNDAKEGVIRRYKLVQEGGPGFEAVIINRGGQLEVMSNREGDWAIDADLVFADLVMPEQKLSDWDVTPMEPGEMPMSKRATDRRSIDANDIMYFTSESLGPNRERTPEGFMICYDVPVARIGEMIYAPNEVPRELGVGPGGRIRVTRAASEVFDRRSMASLNGKPVTDDHPPVDVDPKNWHYYTKGVVVNPHRGEDDQADFLLADMIIYDEEMISDIDAGKREVSCGYNPDYVEVLDGATMQPIPGRGEQVKIRYNHLALVKAGRCGPNCAIGDQRTVDEEVVDTFFTPERARRLRRVLKHFV